MEQEPLRVPREDILCGLFCSLVCIPSGLISLQPPENHVDVFCNASSTAPCSLLLKPSRACRRVLARALARRGPPHGQQQGTQQWEEMAVVGDDMGGVPHTGCPVGDSLSGDACVSGIIFIWLKAKIRVGKKLAAKGWLALGVKGGAGRTRQGGSPYPSAPVCSTCRCAPVVPATTLLSVIFVSLYKASWEPLIKKPSFLSVALSSPCCSLW